MDVYYWRTTNVNTALATLQYHRCVSPGCTESRCRVHAGLGPSFQPGCHRNEIRLALLDVRNCCWSKHRQSMSIMSTMAAISSLDNIALRSVQCWRGPPISSNAGLGLG